MLDWLRAQGARPWQVFVVCSIVFVLIDVLRHASKEPFQLGDVDLIGPICTAALFTILWWAVWGRFQR